jgi:hypothetical protein
MMKQIGSAAWTRFRRLPWWGQVLVGLVLLSVLAAPFSEEDGEVVATAPDADRTATTERQTTTTERQSTTTTRPAAPEGGFRSSDAELASAGTEVGDGLVRSAVVYEDLALLDALVVAPETDAGSYDRSAFPHWDDADRDGCDTRCEVLTAQRLADGAWFSEWDGATEVDSSLVHVDHVVALAEAWRSGAHAWSAAERDEFADDRANLLAVTAASNLRKGDKDAAGWFPSRHAANCLWARTTVLVKAEWDLTVDPAEADALRNVLTSCGAVPPTTTTTTTTTTAPPTTVAVQPVAPAPAPSGNCTPGYSPCLPPASDYDCAGGDGDGPAYTGTVSVDHAHGDPYDLDRDRNGVGCQS